MRVGKFVPCIHNVRQYYCPNATTVASFVRVYNTKKKSHMENLALLNNLLCPRLSEAQFEVGCVSTKYMI